ncbi:FIST signal transduction protein [Thaumasiovibrio sp. DFM-14]|uniref:FIST signal transduction protein n=1 Tax=Thaumasiovibrio sp. DFM-14 TaxID=3384792 RepID=UPI0039A1956D
MYIATAGSNNTNTHTALTESIEQLSAQISQPEMLLVYFTISHDSEQVKQVIQASFPDAQILGCTSCQGAMCDAGFYPENALVLWAVEDKNGAYGTAVTNGTYNSAYSDAQECIKSAIESSQRKGELPALVLLHATPGHEEGVIAGIQSIIGPSVPIVGGSAADNKVRGDWSIFANDKCINHGISIAVFYPSCEVSLSFHSGYASTGTSAIATKVEGREIIELDGRPAAELYQGWLKSVGSEAKSDDDFFSLASMNPLGRVAGEINGTAYFKLSHPYGVTPRQGIKLFSYIEQSDRVYFMAGTRERLIKRAGRVIDSAMELSSQQYINPIGGIAIYCAGCMLQVKESMPDVRGFMYNAMHQKPFSCAFTYGEQGQFLGGENAHGNLMISAVLFYSETVSAS